MNESRFKCQCQCFPFLFSAPFLNIVDIVEPMVGLIGKKIKEL